MKKPVRITLKVIAVILVLALINCIPMFSLKTWKMTKTVVDGTTVYYEPQDQNAIAPLVDKINENKAKITNYLSFATTDDIAVIIYPSKKVLHQKTIGFIGWFLPEWFIGDNTKNYVLITSPNNPGQSHSRESIIKASVHEYVHVVTDRKNQKLDYWLKEGIALYLADQKPYTDSVRQYRNISYRDFNRTNALRFAEVGGYTLAYTLIDYINTTYGWSKVIELIDEKAGYQQVLGKDKEAFFEEWTAYLDKI